MSATDAATIEYLRQHDVGKIVNEAILKLVAEKPASAEAWLAEYFGALAEKGAAAEEPAAPALAAEQNEEAAPAPVEQKKEEVKEEKKEEVKEEKKEEVKEEKKEDAAEAKEDEAPQAHAAKKSVAILATSANHYKLKDGTFKPTGCWYEELAAAYQILSAAGHDVSIYSVAGGAVPFDHGSFGEAFFTEHCKAFAASAASEKAANTEAAASAMGKIMACDAVYFPGGHGAYGDYHNAAVKDVITGFYTAGKPVAIVCHGPAALCNPDLVVDGKPLVAGHEVTAFSDEEETQVGMLDLVPYSVPQELEKLGGKVSNGAAWQPHVVVSGQLLTGQNPQSSAPLAEALLEKLAA